MSIKILIRRWGILSAWIVAASLMGKDPFPVATAGLPFVRSYSLNEMGASRGARIGFDHLGRVALVGGQTFSVLNDNTWISLTDEGFSFPDVIEMKWDARSRRYYFGSLGAWGTMEVAEDGRIMPRFLQSDSSPRWIRATNFNQVLMVEGGVLFAGYNGVVHEKFERGRTEYIEIPELVRIFGLGSEVFASSHSEGLMRLDLEDHSLYPINRDHVVSRVARLDSSHVLFSTTSQRMLEFDGRRLTPWKSAMGPVAPGIVSHLQTLSDGSVAIAIDGKGVFVFSREGDLRLSLSTVEFHRIFDLEGGGEGIFWLTTEASVQKIFYRSGVSIVDQRSGVVVNWPRVVECRGRTSIASQGLLYDMISELDELSVRFELVPDLPAAGVWGIAAQDGRMLVGNGTGVYARSENGFEPVVPGLDTKSLAMTPGGNCFVLGKGAIGLLRWDGATWREVAERIGGVGFPSIVHVVGESVWVELGQNLAARIWESDGRLRSRIFDQFPWEEPTWINIGQAGDYAVLCGPGNERLFFDEKKGELVEAPELDEVLNRAPFDIKRVEEDANGLLWGAHENGVLILDPNVSKEWINPVFGSFRDRFPLVQLVGADQVWVSTQSTLYHLDRDLSERLRGKFEPTLVSITDGRTGGRLYTAGTDGAVPQSFPYAQNHLVLRFFAGGYGAVQKISYRFTLSDRAEVLTIPSADSLLTLPNLWEGTYSLRTEVLEGETRVAELPPLVFRIQPPWFRTTGAYAAYVVLFLLGVWAVRAIAVRRAVRKHDFLEALVRKRTEELGVTMAKLTEHARNSATLAERNRLAGEIHDSVQQGLTGLILQLDATLKLPNLAPNVHTRLAVARRMVSYTREEVQQAVWDLESPLLENASLPDAMRSVADLVAESQRVEFEVNWNGESLDPSTQHHLLRIAQEGITNAVRHSESERIVVALDETEVARVFEIRDFGRGFLPHEILADGPGHFGLRGVRARVEKIGGEFEIISEAGRGTTLRVTIPKARAAAKTDGAKKV